jgi:hypothetical protein
MEAARVGTNLRLVTLTVQTLVLEVQLQVVAPHLAVVKVVAQTAVLQQEAQLLAAQHQAAQHQAAQLLVDQLVEVLHPEVREVEQAENLAVAAQAASISPTKTQTGGDSDA